MFCLKKFFNSVVKYEELHCANRMYGHYIFEMFRQYRIIVCGPTAVGFFRCFFTLVKPNNVFPSFGNNSRINRGIAVGGGIVVKREAMTWVAVSCFAGEGRVQQVVHLLLQNKRFGQRRLATTGRFTSTKIFIGTKNTFIFHANHEIIWFPVFLFRKQIIASVVFGTSSSTSIGTYFSLLVFEARSLKFA